MKQILFFILLVFINGSIIFSQSDEINTIRKIYNSIKTDEISFHELNFNSVLPAVGPKHTTIKFYYESFQINPEEDPYAMKIILKFIEVDYNYSGHTNYHSEYLFDENEYLIFYFVKAAGSYENFEKRYYYKDEKLIKAIAKESDKSNEESINSSNSKFSINEIKNAEGGKLNSLLYKDQFKNMLKLEKIN